MYAPMIQALAIEQIRQHHASAAAVSRARQFRRARRRARRQARAAELFERRRPRLRVVA
jgi:hypothetical protein